MKALRKCTVIGYFLRCSRSDLKHSRQLETSKTLGERNLRQSLLVPRVRGRGYTTRAAQRAGQTTKNGLMDPPLIEGRETTITRHLQRTYYNHKGEMIGGINGGVFLLEPSRAMFNEMAAALMDPTNRWHIPSSAPEQDVLTRVFDRSLRGIHPKYNWQLQ